MKSKKEDEQVIKVLLLGTGGSGKSTVFKQMQLEYGQGFSDHEKQRLILYIH